MGACVCEVVTSCACWYATVSAANWDAAWMRRKEKFRVLFLVWLCTKSTCYLAHSCHVLSFVYALSNFQLHISFLYVRFVCFWVRWNCMLTYFFPLLLFQLQIAECRASWTTSETQTGNKSGNCWVLYRNAKSVTKLVVQREGYGAGSEAVSARACVKWQKQMKARWQHK